MQIFFHDVGLQGANRDFPKTVFGNVAIDQIVEHVPNHLREVISAELSKEFPSGFCNAWGVPDGAKSVIKNLNRGDVMLLVKTTGGNGEMPALCRVKSFWREHMPDLSDFLWNSRHFPYVFFFETQEINLSWHKFKADIGYAPKFRPSGSVYRVREDRFEPYGGASGYLSSILNAEYASTPSPVLIVSEPSRVSEQIDSEEAFQNSIQSVATPEIDIGPVAKKAKKDTGSSASAWPRDPAISAIALKNANFKCEVDASHVTFISKVSCKPFMEAHHFIPMEYQESFNVSLDVPENILSLCPNCHREFHHADNEAKKNLVMKFFKERNKQLETRGIYVDVQSLIELYTKEQTH